MCTPHGQSGEPVNLRLHGESFGVKWETKKRIIRRQSELDQEFAKGRQALTNSKP